MGQKLRLDFTGVTSYKTAAEGKHTMKVASAEVKQSQGGNDMIVVAFEVTKGPDKGARVFENFVLADSSLWKLKGFLEAIGMKADGKLQLDVDKLLGKICTVTVAHEDYNGQTRARAGSIMKYVPESSDDDDLDDEEEIEEEAEEDEEEEASKKKSGKKAPMNKPEPEDDDDDWDEDEEEEEPEEKPKKSSKKAAEKKIAKKESKKKEESSDDDWDDDDDDWDEA